MYILNYPFRKGDYYQYVDNFNKSISDNNIVNDLIEEINKQKLKEELHHKEGMRRFLQSLTSSSENKQKQPDKGKILYKMFNFEGRRVTLCAVSSSNQGLKVGYSIKHPGDTSDKQLGKKIAFGRANSRSALISGEGYELGYNLLDNRRVLSAILDDIKAQIISGQIKLKGIV